MIHRTCAACLLGLAALSAPPAFAAPDAPQTIRGTIDQDDPRDGRPYEDHTVTLAAGGRYAIGVDAADFDALLLVFADGGSEPLDGNDDAEGTNPRLVFVAGNAGPYTLRVLGFESGSTGRYTLTVTPLAPLPAPARPQASATDTITQHTYTGSLDDDDIDDKGKKVDDYLFTFEAGKPVGLGVSADGAAFDPLVAVFAVDRRGGEPLAFDDDSGGELNAQLYFVPEAAGDYVVRVTTVQDEGRGAYQLKVSQ